MNLKNKTAVVVGLGISGQAAVKLLLREGARVIATDRAPREQFSAPSLLPEVEYLLGGHDGVPFSRADLIVVSPGVPDFPALEQAAAVGVEVIGETELASRLLSVPLCAVGGTNGKSSVTTLLGHLLEAGDLRVFVGGNLGQPACEAPGQGVEVALLEVSSFQMERVAQFRPRAAALLNMTEDHLDRYDSFEHYAFAKGNCFAQQKKGDYAVIPSDCPRCAEQVARGGAKVVTFGPEGDYFVEAKVVVERATGRRYDLSDCDLHGHHNHENAAAAIAMGRIMGLSSAAVQEGLRRFRALPHRMALVGHHNGVAFYDDSKATNVGSAVTALRGLTEPRGVLIAGGRDKLGAFDALVSALKEKGRAAVLIGEAAERLEQAIAGAVPVQRAGSMELAVHRAAAVAQVGDAVLLSPACSSLDMFKNYSERGERFTEAVGALSSAAKEHPR